MSVRIFITNGARTEAKNDHAKAIRNSKLQAN